MLFQRKIRLSILGGSALLIALLAVVLLSGRTEGTAQGPRMILHDEQGNDIEYGIAFDPLEQRANGLITYDYMARQGVQAYVDFNRSMAQQIIETNAEAVRTNVVFAYPLSEADFTALVKHYQAEVHSYRMRAVAADGTRVTIAGAPQGETLVPEALFVATLDDVTDKRGAEFKGWIEADVTVNAASFKQMQDDPSIFVTEAVYSLLYAALSPTTLQHSGASREAIQAMQLGLHGQSDFIQISSPPLYWQLEDNGFVPMPEHTQRE